MRVRIELPEQNLQPIWLVIDETTTRHEGKDKDGKVVHRSIEKSVRCNIAIVDYRTDADAEKIANAITKTLQAME